MEGTIGEIRMFAGNFAPRAWNFCNGGLLAISSNTAFFSIIGCTYGGDCRTTFALPDLRGRVAVGVGTGPGLSPIALGERGGSSTVSLTSQEIPVHSHNVTGGQLKATNEPLSSNSPANSMFPSTAGPLYAADANPTARMGLGSVQFAVGTAGGSQGHNNMAPYQGLNYIICAFGIYPSRN